ncbi:hypothetical protein [Pseudorhodoferax sp. Leaf265]|uniref:hypothetical protein n=1 Tax=Pseudorhodoferax sp. Leaf265 TaxID=1736315 RepID=UPI0006F60762|nr:hypothetical protein [Pseudorhodoferax sp. Leaf265]KQP19351.1 hypothetical protein ASF45_25045 [Pseudorhodoferax sp. Leaf265]
MLDRLYALKLTDFQLAVEVIADWRLARYSARKGRRLDLALQTRNLDAPTEAASRRGAQFRAGLAGSARQHEGIFSIST